MFSPSDLRELETGFAGISMSADEFLALGETQERYQLIDGVIARMSRPTMRHQALLSRLVRQLGAHVDRHGGDFFLEIDWRLGDTKVYSPDLACFAPGRVPLLAAYIAVSPDLIIEVLSPGTKAFDLSEKRDDYERAGVREYWAVEQANGRVRCYRRSGELLVEIPVTGDQLESASLPGFTLDLRPLRPTVG